MSRALGSANRLAANPLAGIDAAVAEQLLGEALASGGEYADLYFEFRRAADFVMEEGQVRSVGRVFVVGLGVRVLRGDATGYAYTEELSSARMREAARTAGQIAAAGRKVAPVALTSLRGSDTYPVPESSLAEPGPDKVALLRRADAAARGFDARIVRVEVSLAEEWREILVFTSDGRLAQDRQPMLRLGVHAVAEEAGRRQGGRSGTALRRGLELFALPGHAPEEHGREAARIAIAMLHAQEAPAGPMEVVLGPGESGILLHEAVGHGLEADFNRKKTSNYTDQIGKSVASQSVYRGRRRDRRPCARFHQRGRRRQPRPAQPAHRERRSARLLAGPHLGSPLSHRGHGQRPAREFSLPAAAAHDQHHAARGPGRPGRHCPFGAERDLRQALLGRPGEHLATATSCSRSPRAI